MLLHPDRRGRRRTTAQRVIDALSQPFAQGDLSFTVTCSIGIALYPQDGADMDELLRHADKENDVYVGTEAAQAIASTSRARTSTCAGACDRPRDAPRALRDAFSFATSRRSAWA